MKPIIIIPKETKEITLTVDEYREQINTAYNGGFNDGFEQGKRSNTNLSYNYRNVPELPLEPKC